MLSGEELEMCRIQSCSRPPGATPQAVGFVFNRSFQLHLLHVPQQARTPGVVENGDSTDPEIFSLPKRPSEAATWVAFSLFSSLTQHLLPQPPPWAQLSTSVPKEGPAHGMMHTRRSTAPGHREPMEPCWLCRTAAGREEKQDILWGPD